LYCELIAIAIAGGSRQIAIRLSFLAFVAFVGLGGTTTAGARVRVLWLTPPAPVSGKAAIAVEVSRAATCSITVYGKDGPSRAPGLHPKRSIAGRVSWTWGIGQKSGRWSIEVNCGAEGSLRAALVVSGPKLAWAPPPLTNPITVNVPSTAPVTVNLDSTKDYVLKLGHVSGPGGVNVNGGHNVVIIGGQVTATPDTTESDGYAMRFYNQTGIVHIEGVLIDQSNDGITIEAPNAVAFQIENVRVSNNHAYQDNWNYAHPDIIQTWSGPSQVRLDHFTGYSDYQGLTWMDAGSGFVYPGSIVAKNVNIGPLMRQPGSVQPSPTTHPMLGQYVWHVSPATTFSCVNCYAVTGWYSDSYQRRLFESAGTFNCWDATQYTCYTEWGNHVFLPYTMTSSDGTLTVNVTSRTQNDSLSSTYPALGVTQGDYETWPSVSALVNEKWYFGTPAGGDFVPAGVAGVNYVSPGYVSTITAP
jgi:hypothetical protein